MAKAYMFLAPGFEETEAVVPLDLMRRAGIDVLTVGIGGTLITGTHGITVTADLTDTELGDTVPDIVVLPGGMPGTLNLAASGTVAGAVCAVVANGGLLCAICAAPRIPGALGLLRGRRVTCYPGNEKYLDGAACTGERCVTDGNVITAKGAGAAVEFGLAVVAAVCGREKADALAASFIAK